MGEPHRFEKGNPFGGRPKGSKNKVTNDIRQVFHRTYETMGTGKYNKDGSKMTGEQAFLDWAQENPTEFYRLYGKMIPTTQEMLEDSHEDFVDDLVFIDEQEKIIEGQANVVDVGNEGQKQLPSGADIVVDDKGRPNNPDTDVNLV